MLTHSAVSPWGEDLGKYLQQNGGQISCINRLFLSVREILIVLAFLYGGTTVRPSCRHQF
jgi:hypothetical protein